MTRRRKNQEEDAEPNQAIGLPQFELTFSSIQCIRCEAMRQARFPCPECGKKPRDVEVDRYVQQRKKAIAEAKVIQDAEPKYRKEDLDLQVLLGSDILLELIDETFEVANEIVSKNSNGPNSLSILLATVETLRAWYETAVELRPNINVVRLAKVALHEIMVLCDAVVSALQCESLTDAQEMQGRIQECLDSATEAVVKAGNIFEVAFDIHSSSNPVGILLQKAGLGDPSHIVETGKIKFEEKTKRPCGVATSMVAAVNELSIPIFGDEQNFWNIVNAHIALLLRDPTTLKGILESSLFVDRISDAAYDYLSHARHSYLGKELDSLRGEVSDILGTGHLIVEQGLKLHLGILCAIHTRKSFEDTQGCDVSELCNIANDNGWLVARSLGTSDIRNAFAHRDYSIVDQQYVSLSPSRRRRDGKPEVVVDVQELHAESLMTLEAVNAMELALYAVAEELDIDLVISPRGDIIAETFLTGIGWEDISISRDNGKAIISATVAQPQQLSNLAFVVNPYKDIVEEVIVYLTRSDTGDGASIAIVVNDHMCGDGAAEEYYRTIAVLNLMNRVKVNGKQVYKDSQIAKCIAVSAMEALADTRRSFREVADELKAWKNLASRLGFEDLSRSIRGGIRFRARVNSGEKNVEAPNTEVIRSYASEEVPPIPKFYI